MSSLEFSKFREYIYFIMCMFFKRKGIINLKRKIKGIFSPP
jgi:hypothetical protein